MIYTRLYLSVLVFLASCFSEPVMAAAQGVPPLRDQQYRESPRATDEVLPLRSPMAQPLKRPERMVARDRGPDFHRWYAGAAGFLVSVTDADPRTSLDGERASGAVKFENGQGFAATLGYRVAPQYRLEGELSKRSSDKQAAFQNPGSDPALLARLSDTGVLNPGGSVESTALMVNFIYDDPWKRNWLPYFGAGIGAVWLEDAGASTAVGALQVLTGVSYRMENGHELYGGYRFFRTVDPKYEVAGLNVSSDYVTHNLEVGFRYGF